VLFEGLRLPAWSSRAERPSIQVELTAARLHVWRVKSGSPSIYSLRGDEIRALRRLLRERGASAHVFSTPCPDAKGRAPFPVWPMRTQRAAAPPHSRPGPETGSRGCWGSWPCRDAQAPARLRVRQGHHAIARGLGVSSARAETSLSQLLDSIMLYVIEQGEQRF